MVSHIILPMQEYIDVFQPLMLEECSALLKRGKVEAEEMPEPCRCITGPASLVCYSSHTLPSSADAIQ